MRMIIFASLALVALSLPAAAAEPIVSFDTDFQRERYDRMLEEYRCLKCQNQNLAGSNAALAGDLRREIREQILEGNDDKAIDDYLVARYGDFVRYSPRFGGANLVLWLGPVILLVVGLVAGVSMARRSQARRTPMPDQASITTARALLADKDA